MYYVQLLALHFEFLSSFPASCLPKDHFASKPIDKHTTVHLKPHELNLHSPLLHCAVEI